MPNMKKKAEKVCLTCSRTFVAQRPTQVFCRKTCVRHGGRNHPICPCGVQTDSYMKKYCCTEHRVKWGSKKAPVRMVEHVCQQCKRTFERPWNYPNKKMFCSVKCSNKQHSRNRQQHWRYGNAVLNSGYELRFAAVCERLGVPWEPWPDDRPFRFEHDGSDHTYTPDFLVYGEYAVETKGYEYADSLQPIARQRWDFPEKLVLVQREQLQEVERIFSEIQFALKLEAARVVQLPQYD